MTETDTNVTPKRRGRPPKIKTATVEREPMRESAKPAKRQMRAEPNWAEIDPMAEDTVDRLRIPKEMFPEGFDLRWVRDSAFGQPDSQWRSNQERAGWTPVHQEDFDGRFDGRFMRKGDPKEINVDGVVLMARPLEISIRARQRDLRAASERAMSTQEAVMSGNIQVSLDSQHPTALRTNKFSKSYERIEVPADSKK